MSTDAPSADATPEASAIERMNRECFCIGADLPALHAWLQADLERRGLQRPILETHAHLFSALPVFVSRANVDRMRGVIDAVEAAVALGEFQQRVLDRAPEIARFDPGARGVFLGYDFHLDAEQPRLIEINTNAGGALLNVALGRAQRACCEPVEHLLTGRTDVVDLEERLFQMFLDEWRLAGRSGRPARIAIVDDDPSAQYLFPEFLLFQRMFELRGMAASVADAARLEWRAGELRLDGAPIDLVYNRLTDFYLERPEHAALRSAYLAHAAVVTPHPRAHALYADKRNLALLSDAQRLRDWRLDEVARVALTSGIARTELVSAASAEALWRDRKRLFFKPASGFGSRGAYRGAKLTRKTFAEILASDYVAQEFVPPSERAARDAVGERLLRLDVRNYVYAGEVQLLAARLYQGQTTNFRTPGGGFAPVFYPPA